MGPGASDGLRAPTTMPSYQYSNGRIVPICHALQVALKHAGPWPKSATTTSRPINLEGWKSLITKCLQGVARFTQQQYSALLAQMEGGAGFSVSEQYLGDEFWLELARRCIYAGVGPSRFVQYVVPEYRWPIWPGSLSNDALIQQATAEINVSYASGNFVAERYEYLLSCGPLTAHNLPALLNPEGDRALGWCLSHYRLPVPESFASGECAKRAFKDICLDPNTTLHYSTVFPDAVHALFFRFKDP